MIWDNLYVEEGKGNLRVRNVECFCKLPGWGSKSSSRRTTSKEEKQAHRRRSEGTCTAQSQGRAGGRQACSFPLTHARAGQSGSSPGKGKALPEMNVSPTTVPRSRQRDYKADHISFTFPWQPVSGLSILGTATFFSPPSKLELLKDLKVLKSGHLGGSVR